MDGETVTVTSQYKEAYGSWAGNERGYKADHTKCAKEIWGSHLSKQCSRKRGYGIDEAFCKQHERTDNTE